MQIKVFNQSEFGDFRQLFSQLSNSLDIYYSPDFLTCETAIQGGEAEIFVVEDDGDWLIYPYLKLGFGQLRERVPELCSARDVTSPYGYGGPFVSNVAKIGDFEKAWIQYAKESAFVSEFVRYHPLCSSLFSSGINNTSNRNIVILELDRTWEDIWEKQFSSTTRNLVRKMEKEGFECRFCVEESEFEEFIELYYSTMDALDADQFYYFTRSYFWQLRSQVGERLRLAKVAKEGQTYCMSLFLTHGRFVNYYLSGRNRDFNKVPSTNYMLKFVAQWAHENGFRTFNLGGGKTGNEDDSLYRFKRNFSKAVADFKIGRRVLNESLYQKVVKEFVNDFGEDHYQAKKGILHFYRLKNWLKES